MGPQLGVAHVVLTLDSGGLERVVLDLATAGRAAGQRVLIACLERRGRLASEAESGGLEMVCGDFEGGINLEKGRFFRRVFGAFGPDVVHSHQVGALMYAGPAARRAGVPVTVHTEHNNHFSGRGWGIGKFKSTRMRILWRMAASYADRFVCVSGDAARGVLENRIAREDRVGVIRNGIDLARFSTGRAGARESLGIPAGAPVVGTVGRLTEIKRQDILVEVFSGLLGRFPDAHLLIVGDGALRGRLVEMVEGLGIGHRVHLVGYQAEPERYLRAMDVFVQTSSIEGMPLAVIEAWASGVPVVATRVGGIPEMIEDGRTGWLYEFGDREALSRILAGVLSDPAGSSAIARAGLETARRGYSLEAMSALYFRQYHQLIAAKRHPA